jgi:beta-galactosidase
MHRLINYKNIFGAGFCTTMVRHWRRSVRLFISLFNFLSKRKIFVVKFFVLLCVFVSLWFNSFSQREDILLNDNWTFSSGIKELKYLPPQKTDYYWQKINLPHNADAYDGYRRLLHGNKHGDIWYRKIIKIVQANKNRRNFLFFEGVGSYAKVYLNGKLIGQHAGGRTTFTVDVTTHLKTDGSENE